tara:strand:+ start:1903 stop:2106 length:204 start_codon:yes stop_codon:yes gene_type:complete
LAGNLKRRRVRMISSNGSLPIISILVLAFSMLLITEVFKLKKIQRRLVKKVDILKKEIDNLKDEKVA